MDFRQSINELSELRSELKRRGDIAGALPLAREILFLLEQNGGSPRELANAHGYLMSLYAKSGNLALAEVHARNAIAEHPGGDSPRDHLNFASFSMGLANILARLGNQKEAIHHAEIALKEWTVVLNPADGFLKARMEHLEALRAGKWPPRSGVDS